MPKSMWKFSPKFSWCMQNRGTTSGVSSVIIATPANIFQRMHPFHLLRVSFIYVTRPRQVQDILIKENWCIDKIQYHMVKRLTLLLFPSFSNRHNFGQKCATQCDEAHLSTFSRATSDLESSFLFQTPPILLHCLWNCRKPDYCSDRIKTEISIVSYKRVSG